MAAAAGKATTDGLTRGTVARGIKAGNIGRAVESREAQAAGAADGPFQTQRYLKALHERIDTASIERREKVWLRPTHDRFQRLEKSDTLNAEFKDFKFVERGVFTVGISTSGNLPLHDYASDSKTVIGYDVDLAQVIADRLGLKLNLVSIAWADWPLGLTSGKFDAVISNVTVTEERKLKFDFST